MYQNRLRDLREDKDLKQKDIADMLNIHQTTYSDYELGRLNIPVSSLHILADYYHVSTDYLLGRTLSSQIMHRLSSPVLPGMFLFGSVTFLCQTRK